MTAKSSKMEPIVAPKCPIVYFHEYNINICCGLVQFHAFDARKWGKAYAKLIESGHLSDGAGYEPEDVCKTDLDRIHTKEYLASLDDPHQLSRILEIPGFAIAHFLLGCVINLTEEILHPMRLQTGGTILAAELAMEHGWAINIGGGFHHASGNQGGGFCVYADISIAIKKLIDAKLIVKAMIIDLDAHQGNGHEMDFRFNTSNVYIMDMYNADIYPDDRIAMYAIRKEVKLHSGTSDDEYLSLLNQNLASALEEFSPQLIVYNAGTDLLAGDPLGRLNISAKGIVERDEIVFRFARHRQIPITMVTSGGYTAQSAGLIADSILNLNAKGLIQLR